MRQDCDSVPSKAAREPLRKALLAARCKRWREKHREHNRLYRLANRVHIREVARVWDRSNRDRRSMIFSRWYYKSKAELNHATS
jgi:hypothetical protein